MLVVDNVSYRYGDGAEGLALRGVSLSVAPGECVALIGPNGSGKSTLAGLLNGMKRPCEGTVEVDGLTTCDKTSARRVRALVGVVRQDPACQLVATIVADDVAFGPRNLDLAEDEVRARVARALEQAGIADLAQAETSALSGGQQQRVALAGVLAMEPCYLVLDEATAMLDSAARRSFRALVCTLAREKGLGVVMVTHDALEALAADRVAVLEGGQVRWEGAPAALAVEASALLEKTLRLDRYARVVVKALRAGYDAADGLEPEDVAAWCAGTEAGRRVARAVAGLAQRGSASQPPHPGRAALGMEDVSFSYGEQAVLNGCTLSLGAGERVLVAGVSGAGKSTLSLLLAGLEEPDAGCVRLHGKAPRAGEVGMVFQRPESQLFMDTVRDDVAFGPRNLGLAEEEVARRVERACEELGLDAALLERHPATLSGGQARRAALAGIAAMEPRAYVLDEPTAGLDVAGRRFLHALVGRLAQAGAPVAVMSHDLEEWADEVDAVALLGAGRVARVGAPGALAAHPEAFEAVGLEPPEIARFARACAERGCAL